jgi:hypothetical protein
MEGQPGQEGMCDIRTIIAFSVLSFLFFPRSYICIYPLRLEHWLIRWFRRGPSAR